VAVNARRRPIRDGEHHLVEHAALPGQRLGEDAGHHVAVEPEGTASPGAQNQSSLAVRGRHCQHLPSARAHRQRAIEEPAARRSGRREVEPGHRTRGGHATAYDQDGLVRHGDPRRRARHGRRTQCALGRILDRAPGGCLDRRSQLDEAPRRREVAAGALVRHGVVPERRGQFAGHATALLPEHWRAGTGHGRGPSRSQPACCMLPSVQAPMDIYPGISMNPGVRFGKPCIAGTRIDVATVVGLIAAGALLPGDGASARHAARDR